MLTTGRSDTPARTDSLDPAEVRVAIGSHWVTYGRVFGSRMLYVPEGGTVMAEDQDPTTDPPPDPEPPMDDAERARLVEDLAKDPPAEYEVVDEEAVEEKSAE